MGMFDPKYIHCTWDDSLKGKLVFYGDIIGDFKEEVEKADLDSRLICYEYTDDESYPFDIKYMRGGQCSHTKWQFVYYDPNYEVKVAYYKDGKQIQFKSHIVDKWSDCSVEPCWDDNCDYRVKPDEPETHDSTCYERCGYCIHRLDGCTSKPAGSCINFISTNDDYFRVKKVYVDLVKGHVELERKYGALVSGIQQLMHNEDDIHDDAGQVK